MYLARTAQAGRQLGELLAQSACFAELKSLFELACLVSEDE
jgi:hypothetical protein